MFQAIHPVVSVRCRDAKYERERKARKRREAEQAKFERARRFSGLRIWVTENDTEKDRMMYVRVRVVTLVTAKVFQPGLVGVTSGMADVHRENPTGLVFCQFATARFSNNQSFI